MRLEYQEAEFRIGWRLGAAGKDPNQEQSSHVLLMRGYGIGYRDWLTCWKRDASNRKVICPLCSRSCTLKSDATFRYHSGCLTYGKTLEQAKTFAALKPQSL